MKFSYTVAGAAVDGALHQSWCKLIQSMGDHDWIQNTARLTPLGSLAADWCSYHMRAFSSADEDLLRGAERPAQAAFAYWMAYLEKDRSWHSLKAGEQQNMALAALCCLGFDLHHPVDLVLIYSPYGCINTETRKVSDGLVGHFATLAERHKIPVLPLNTVDEVEEFYAALQEEESCESPST